MRDHLRTCALLEALISLWAVAFPWIFAAGELLYGPDRRPRPPEAGPNLIE